MAVCENCSSYCHKKPLVLKMEEGTKTICSDDCLKEFKEVQKRHDYSHLIWQKTHRNVFWFNDLSTTCTETLYAHTTRTTGPHIVGKFRANHFIEGKVYKTCTYSDTIRYGYNCIEGISGVITRACQINNIFCTFWSDLV